MTKAIWLGLTAFLVALAGAGLPSAVAQAPAPQASGGDALPVYKPPPRGAPGGRIGGASRGSETVGMPKIEPLAPDGIAGQTANAAPTLYYFISAAPTQPLRLTIRAPNVAPPLAEVALPAPRAAGVQAVRLSDFKVQLQPGTVYVWSVALVLDPNMPSKNIVGSSTIVRAALDPSVAAAVNGATPVRRAGALAQAGFWYDALAAAAEAAGTDHHAAFDALLDQVGLKEAAAADRTTAR